MCCVHILKPLPTSNTSQYATTNSTSSKPLKVGRFAASGVAGVAGGGGTAAVPVPGTVEESKLESDSDLALELEQRELRRLVAEEWEQRVSHVDAVKEFLVNEEDLKGRQA